MSEKRSGRWLAAGIAALAVLAVTGCGGAAVPPPPQHPDGGAGALDAGSDAGTADAGPSCPALCPEPTPLCDEARGACVQCLADSDCGAARPLCDPAVHECVRCVSDTDCPGEAPRCDRSLPGGQCVQCRGNDDCTTEAPLCEPRRRTCIGPGEACGTATALMVGQYGTTTFTVDTAKASDDEDGHCGDHSGTGDGEWVFSLLLTEPHSVQVRAHAPEGSAADPVLYLRAGTCADGAEVACHDVAGADDSLFQPILPAGQYFLFVEAFRDHGGPTEVTVSLAEPLSTPANDTCAGAEALTFNGDTAAFSTNTVTANDDLSASCNPGGGPEVVYQFELAKPQVVEVSATGDPGVHPVLALRPAPCDASPDAYCDRGATGTGHLLQPLGAGTWFLTVEADAAAVNGAISGTVTVSDTPSGESCAAPQVLSLQPGGSTSFSVDTSLATNDETTPCNSDTDPARAPELVYALTLTQAQDLTVTATPTGSSSSVDTQLSIRAGTCTSGSLACEDYGWSGDPETLYEKNLQPGTYYVFVETYGSTGGALDVQFQLAPPTLPPPGDTCAAPVVLSFPAGSGSTSFQVDTTNAGDEHTGSCSYSYGQEVVYQVTLSQTKTITVTATPTGNADPELYARSGNCTGTSVTELACVDQGWAGAQETMTLSSQPPGDYFLFFETYSQNPGVMDVTVTLSP